jgi:DNA-binding NtrC family response regulator
MKILLVENDSYWLEHLKKEAPDGAVVLSARTLFQADFIFRHNSDIDVVVVDDCLSDPENVDTLPFVEEISRGGFPGVIIASCSNCNHGQMLVQAGCIDYVAKSRLPERLARICGPKKSGCPF